MKLTSIAQEQRFQIEVCLRLWAWNLCGLGIAWWQWLCIYRYDGNEGVLSEIPCLQKNMQMEIKALTPNHSGRTGDVTPKRSFLWNYSCFNAFCADEILIVAEFSWPCWELMFNLRLPIHHPARSQQKNRLGGDVFKRFCVAMPLQTRGRWMRWVDQVLFWNASSELPKQHVQAP